MRETVSLRQFFAVAVVVAATAVAVVAAGIAVAVIADQRAICPAACSRIPSEAVLQKKSLLELFFFCHTGHYASCAETGFCR